MRAPSPSSGRSRGASRVASSGRPSRSPRSRSERRRRRSPPRRPPRARGTRSAIEPGKRWIAGFSRNAGSRSSFASFRGSSVPTRCFSASGPAKAFCTGTCWSIAKPIRSANGSCASSSLRGLVVGEVQRVGHRNRTRRTLVRRACGRYPGRVDPLAAFSPATRSWFEGAFAGPTPAQVLGLAGDRAGGDVLIQAPTGSGKTLTAFLYAIDRLNATPGRGAARALRLAAQGAQLRHRAQPPRPARGPRVEPARRRPHRRHVGEGAPRARQGAAGHPDHDARVALPDAHLGRARDACAASRR